MSHDGITTCLRFLVDRPLTKNYFIAKNPSVSTNSKLSAQPSPLGCMKRVEQFLINIKKSRKKITMYTPQRAYITDAKFSSFQLIFANEL